MAGTPSSDQVFNTVNANGHDDRTPGLNSITDAWGYFQYFCSTLQNTFENNFNGIVSLTQHLPQ